MNGKKFHFSYVLNYGYNKFCIQVKNDTFLNNPLTHKEINQRMDNVCNLYNKSDSITSK